MADCQRLNSTAAVSRRICMHRCDGCVGWIRWEWTEPVRCEWRGSRWQRDPGSSGIQVAAGSRWQRGSDAAALAEGGEGEMQQLDWHLVAQQFDRHEADLHHAREPTPITALASRHTALSAPSSSIHSAPYATDTERHRHRSRRLLRVRSAPRSRWRCASKGHTW